MKSLLLLPLVFLLSSLDVRKSHANQYLCSEREISTKNLVRIVKPSITIILADGQGSGFVIGQRENQTYIITNKSNYKKVKTYKIKGYKILFVDSLKNKEDFYSLYNTIFKLGYSRILLETGLIFLKYVIENKLIDKVYLFKSNEKLKKKGKNNISPNFLKKIKFKPISINLKTDKLFIKDY